MSSMRIMNDTEHNVHNSMFTLYVINITLQLGT